MVKPSWLIDNWFPLGHRCMDTAPEGSFKTITGCWLATCIASGSPVFGLPVRQGNVLLIDEETPEVSLDIHIARFSQGLGYNPSELPIYKLCMEGFRFGRKTELTRLLRLIDAIEPVFIRLDSLLAMLPGGLQFKSENDCHLGEIIRDDLSKIVTPHSTIMLSAHAKKYISDLPLGVVKDMAMQSIVRGHGSIVGEGCDTGFIIKKISEFPKPSRFCIITKARRQAIPAGKNKYIEVKEQKYGSGWARLEEISEDELPPSDFARKVYPIFEVPNKRGSKNHSTQYIVQTCALLTKTECRLAIEELEVHRVVFEKEPQVYCLNPNRFTECSMEYLQNLF